MRIKIVNSSADPVTNPLFSALIMIPSGYNFFSPFITTIPLINYSAEQMYTLGTDCAMRGDFSTAIIWHEAASQRGESRATCELGIIHAAGYWNFGIWVQDWTKALRCFKQIDTQLDPAKNPNNTSPRILEARAYLGKIYYEGYSNQPNAIDYYREAVKYFKAAAIQGHVEATYQFGLMTYHGHGTDQDLEIARTQFTLAAQRGHADAGRWLARLSPRIESTQSLTMQPGQHSVNGSANAISSAISNQVFTTTTTTTTATSFLTTPIQSSTAMTSTQSTPLQYPSAQEREQLTQQLVAVISIKIEGDADQAEQKNNIHNLFERGADIAPALHHAVEHGNVATLKLLVEVNKKKAMSILNQPDKEGDSSIMYAMKKKDMELVKYLVSQGVDLGVRNLVGQTVLSIEYDTSRPFVEAHLRLQQQIAVAEDLRAHQTSELLEQAYELMETSALILQKKELYEQQAVMNLLHEKAKEQIQVRTVTKGQCLNLDDLLAQPNMSMSGSTPLTLAIENGYVELVKQLCAAGGRTGVCDLNSVFHKSLSKTNYEVIAVVRGKIEVQPDIVGSVRDHLLAVLWGIIKLDGWFDVNRRDSDGNTALHIAVKSNAYSMVEVLLKNGADLTIQNCRQQTPRQLAVIEKEWNCVKIIDSFQFRKVSESENTVDLRSNKVNDNDSKSVVLGHVPFGYAVDSTTIRIDEKTNVLDLKIHIETITGIPASEQHILMRYYGVIDVSEADITASEQHAMTAKNLEQRIDAGELQDNSMIGKPLV